MESATPAVDQPLAEVDRREVDKMLMFHFSTMAWSHSYHASSFISLYNSNKLYKKRGMYNDEIQYIQTIEGTQFPKGLKLVQQKNKHYVQYARQPSLVLGGLGRARMFPIACEGSSLGLALQSTKAQ